MLLINHVYEFAISNYVNYAKLAQFIIYFECIMFA